MGLFANLKAALTPAPYIAAAAQLLQGYGTLGAKARPFDADKAVRQFKAWSYAAAMLNANAKANVPRRLYVRSRPGRKLYETRPVPKHVKRYLEGRETGLVPARSIRAKAIQFGGDIEEVVEPHPALTVLQTVNPWQNGYELDLLRMIDLQATGNTYLFVVNNALGVPAQVWRMAPHLTKIAPDPANFIGGYVYGTPPSERRFAPDQVDHLKMPNPKDLLYGMGWFEAAWDAVGLHASKRTRDQAVQDNMGRPDWLLGIPGAKQDALDNFTKNVNEKLQGSGNAGRMLALAGEIKATALNLPDPELGTPTRIIEEISAVSGVPVAMLLSNDPNRANSSTARTGWYRSTIQMYCKLDDEKLNERWLPRFPGAEDMFIAHDLVSFEDQEMQAKRLTGYVAGGILTPNEARAEEGYDPHDDGDDLYPPSGATGGAAATAGDLAPNETGRLINEN